MSLKTWMAEFYPVSANDPSIDTDMKAVEHSLKKWEGLRPDALARHEVATDSTGRILQDKDGKIIFAVDGGSCALCKRSEDNCNFCPLSKVRGYVACDRQAIGEARSPYGAMKDLKNPEPMIAALEQAHAMLVGQP